MGLVPKIDRNLINMSWKKRSNLWDNYYSHLLMKKGCIKREMFSVENIFMSIGSRKKGKSHFGSSIGCNLNFNALEGGRGEGLSLVILTNQ